MLLLIGSYIASSISEHLFTLKAIQKLFTAKTSDEKLFPNPTKAKAIKKYQKNIDSLKDHPKLQKNVTKNRVKLIKFSYWQQFKLFIMKFFSCCGSCCEFDKNKLWKLYSIGNSRIEKEFDIVKILTSIRNMKIMMKKDMDQVQRYKIFNSSKNAIELDYEVDQNSLDSNDDNQSYAKEQPDMGGNLMMPIS